MIYTTYFANLKKLPEYILPIAICAKSPAWYKGLEYKKLAPKYGFFMKWKQNHDNEYYTQCFNDEVLGKLNYHNVYSELYNMVTKNGELLTDIALVCYEKPDDFCHRHLVADWFRKNGINCCECSN